VSSPQPIDADLEARLAALERESAARSADLREIAAQLPAVVGRRAMIRTLVGDVANNPNKGELVRHGFDTVAAIPRQAWNRVMSRLRPHGR